MNDTKTILFGSKLTTTLSFGRSFQRGRREERGLNQYRERRRERAPMFAELLVYSVYLEKLQTEALLHKSVMTANKKTSDFCT